MLTIHKFSSDNQERIVETVGLDSLGCFYPILTQALV